MKTNRTLPAEQSAGRTRYEQPAERSLRERRGLVYNVEANLTSYTDTGVFCIYFGTDPEDADRCIGLVHKELKKLRDSKLSSSQLSAAKNRSSDK